MKLKNAPGRKNARRMTVLDQLKERLTKLKPGTNEYRQAQDEMKRLLDIIVDPASARAIRTKKRRDSRRATA